jgi:hypothetical protein
MQYAIVRHNPPTFLVDSVVTDAPAVPESDSHCFYVELGAQQLCEAGMLFDSATRTFSWGRSSRKLSHLEFMTRIGYPEIVELQAAMSADVEVRTAWAFAENSDYIDLDHPLTVTMLGMFALKGLLTMEQVETLLGGGGL